MWKYSCGGTPAFPLDWGFTGDGRGHPAQRRQHRRDVDRDAPALWDEVQHDVRGNYCAMRAHGQLQRYSSPISVHRHRRHGEDRDRLHQPIDRDDVDAVHVARRHHHRVPCPDHRRPNRRRASTVAESALLSRPGYPGGRTRTRESVPRRPGLHAPGASVTAISAPHDLIVFGATSFVGQILVPPPPRKVRHPRRARLGGCRALAATKLEQLRRFARSECRAAAALRRRWWRTRGVRVRDFLCARTAGSWLSTVGPYALLGRSRWSRSLGNGHRLLRPGRRGAVDPTDDDEL